jgi:hypothetical protein
MTCLSMESRSFTSKLSEGPVRVWISVNARWTLISGSEISARSRAANSREGWTVGELHNGRWRSRVSGGGFLQCTHNAAPPEERVRVPPDLEQSSCAALCMNSFCS